jgi:hypothetical protein
LAVLLVARAGWADDPKAAAKPPDIKFETADKVELKGVFYPGNKSKPCVILVHNFKQDRQKQGWDRLIDALQKNDIAVLSFDLRGHGESTNIADPDVFWRDTMNRSLISGARANKDKISYKEFRPAYYPMLANDLVAAKTYIDKQNDAGACNSSDVFVVAAEDSATIAALWMAYAWQQYPLTANPFGRLVPDTTKQPLGQDIAGAVLLSAPTRWSTMSVLKPLVYQSPAKGGARAVRNKVPLAFVFGGNDKKAASAANLLLRDVKGPSSRHITVPTLTNVKEIKRTKAAGAGLLEQQAADEFIAKFIEAVMGKGASVWSEKKPPTPLLISPGTLSQLAGR